MSSKICFKCNLAKPLNDYYKHAAMADGHLNKCKDCTKADVKVGTIPRVCAECGKTFMALPTEIKRGGAITCSRGCFYKRLPKILDAKFTGKRGYYGIHQLIYRKLGKASICIKCGKTEGKFEWSNISGTYKEDLTDWQQLCIRCHRIYDNTGTKAWITRRKNQAQL